MADLSDNELMVRFQQGNVHAFELLFERYRGPVFSFIYRMLGRERSAAEDLLQEIFVKLSRAKEFYEPKAKFSTWLFTITRNHCLNFINSRAYSEGKRTISFDVDQAIPPEFLQTPASAQGEPTEMERREQQEILEEAICSLPGGYRDVFILRAVQGFSYDDIAGILNINPPAARTTYHRARLMLQHKLGNVFGGGRGDSRSPGGKP